MFDILKYHQLLEEDQLLLYAKDRRDTVCDDQLLDYLIKIGDKQTGDKSSNPV